MLILYTLRSLIFYTYLELKRKDLKKRLSIFENFYFISNNKNNFLWMEIIYEYSTSNREKKRKEILIHLHKIFAFSDVGKNMGAFLNRCVRAWVKSELRYKVLYNGPFGALKDKKL